MKGWNGTGSMRPTKVEKVLMTIFQTFLKVKCCSDNIKPDDGHVATPSRGW